MLNRVHRANAACGGWSDSKQMHSLCARSAICIEVPVDLFDRWQGSAPAGRGVSYKMSASRGAAMSLLELIESV